MMRSADVGQQNTYLGSVWLGYRNFEDHIIEA